MATRNPFGLLDDDDNGDPSALLNILAAPKGKPAAAAAAAKKQQPATVANAKLPSKPLPPAQAVRESRAPPSEGGRGRGGGRGGRGFGSREPQEFGRGRGGSYNGDRNFNRENNAYQGARFNENSSDLIPSRHEDGEGASSDRGRGGGGGRAGGRGGRGGRGAYGGRGGFGDEAGGDDRSRRAYERRSGSGRGFEMKREGSGRGNWGTPVDEAAFQEPEEVVSAEEEKRTVEEKPDQENSPETPVVNEEKKEEEEDKEMTLDEYEKLREEKRKALLPFNKVEERKVDVKEFESMQVLANKKKDEDAIFMKLGSDKEKGKKIDLGENERVRKAVSINEFLKPTEGEKYYSGGRGRGRGRGERGGFRGGYSGGYASYPEAPSIEDPRQFPTLGGK